MPFDQKLSDKKGNLVVVTIFETYLAKFILEHSDFYQAPYLKIIEGIQRYLSSRLFLAAMIRQDERYSLPRHVYSLFSRVNDCFPGIDSFDALKARFTLPAADYLIKLVNDECFPSDSPVSKYEENHDSVLTLSPRFFMMTPGATETRRSPLVPSRSPTLFADENRGVRERSSVSEPSTSRALGIVSAEFTPEDCKTYFSRPISPAGHLYEPDLESKVGAWLSRRHLPIVSGASGSTEALISRVFPLLTLDDSEKRMVIFAQSCNLIAHGHHSLGECFLVAQQLGFKCEESHQLIDYYKQCIPESIRTSRAFIDLMDSQLQPLLAGMPLKRDRDAPSAAMF